MTNIRKDHLVLISGKSATGKSVSLQYLKDSSNVMYLNCEAGKLLPFKNDFKELIVTNTDQIYQAFTEAEKMEGVHTIVIDTLTYLMDMYESTRVLTSTKTMQAWGHYAQYMKILMSQFVAKSTKNIIFLAHTADILNEKEMVHETMVKVKGSLMANGVESFFTNVISTKKLALTSIDEKQATSELYTVTEEEEELGYKYVYQTKLTRDTVNERIRAPIGMWKINETYIDNNVQYVLDRLHNFYGKDN